jgi:hypothetical protein
MKTYKLACLVIAVAGLLGAPWSAMAQSTTTAPPHVPLQKTIGQAGPDIVPSLIVMNSRGATLQGGKLTLIGIAPNTIVFADRPVRAAGHAMITDLLQEWAPGNEDDDSFNKNPPNATVSVFSKDGSAIRDAVIVLKTPKLEGDRLTFDVDVLEGNLNGADGPAAVFIDFVRFGGGGFARGGFAGGGFARGGFAGGGFARGGFAAGGVARGGFVGAGHVGYVGHAAWYGAPALGLGAAAVGGAAIGAAAVGAAAAGAYNPYYYPNGAMCGYYPYPPCY